jgi:hypothetical protein
MLNFLKSIFQNKKEQNPVYEVWQEYLNQDPIQAGREHIVRLIEQQVEGTRVSRLNIGESQTLARTYPTNEPGENRDRARAIGLLSYFTARAECKGKKEDIAGAFTWLIINLDKQSANENMYLDLGRDVETALKKFKFRIYECEIDLN